MRRSPFKRANSETDDRRVRGPGSSEAAFTRVRAARRRAGFTLLEVMLVLVIVGIMAAITAPMYTRYREKSLVAQAVTDITAISGTITLYEAEWRRLPDSLAAIGMDDLEDPWGNPYAYLRIDGASVPPGQLRKGKNLVPINTDFDLYSKGADGKSKRPLTAKDSHDDVIRANDGGFVGVAENY